MPLSDAAIRALKPSDQRQEYADGKGLVLIVGTSGEKSWVVRYKDAQGRSGRKTIGTYPALRLSDARDEAVVFKRSVKAGEAGVRSRGAEKASLGVSLVSPGAMTVDQAFEHYMDRKGNSLSRPKVRRANYERDIAPHVGHLPITELDTDTLIAVFDAKFKALVAKGRTGRGAGNLHTETGAFLTWCRREGRAITGMKHNPMEDVAKVAKAISKDRYLSAEELKLFFECLPAAGAFAAPIELMLRSACRRSEIMGITKAMVRLDADNPHIDIPKTKNGLPYLMPLVPSMLALIPALDDLQDDDVIWRSPREGALCADALSKPVERLVTKMGIERWSLHDLRRSASTHMNSFMDENFQPRIQEHVVERVLNHVPQGVKATYNRHSYYAEKRRALTVWNDWLDTLA